MHFLVGTNKKNSVANNFDLIGDGVWSLRLRRNLNDWECEHWMRLMSHLEQFSLIPKEKVCWV